MDYELAKKLKDAGFPQDWSEFEDHDSELLVKGWNLYGKGYSPRLPALIESCDKMVKDLVHISGHLNEWSAVDGRDGFGIYSGHGSTPEEAVANLWLELNKKK